MRCLQIGQLLLVSSHCMAQLSSKICPQGITIALPFISSKQMVHKGTSVYPSFTFKPPVRSTTLTLFYFSDSILIAFLTDQLLLDSQLEITDLKSCLNEPTLSFYNLATNFLDLYSGIYYIFLAVGDPIRSKISCN